MSKTEDGVTTWTVTRGQMIQALQQIPVAEEPPQPEAPAPARRRRPTLRRTPPVAPPAPVPHKVTCPLAEADEADLLLAHFPELEPASLKAVKQAEGIIAERDQEIRFLREEDVRKAVTITDLRKSAEGDVEARRDIDLVLDGIPGLPQDGGHAAAVSAMAERLKAAEAQNITLREALAGGHLLELADLRAKVADYENAIAWNTSCTACARTLDSSIAEHERADRAEQKLAAVVPALERFAAPGAITATDRRKAASDALGTAQQGDAEVAP